MIARERSLKFQWEPPIPEDRNGEITGYEYNLTEQNSWNNVDTVGLTWHVFKQQLTPYTNYTVKIAAMTSVGVGPYSEPIFARTKEDSKCIISY